jgi:uncharacterized coiled-coil DUF342 family protein
MSDTHEIDSLHSEIINLQDQRDLEMKVIKRLEGERDEAIEKLADWENAAAHVESDHPDEVHCGCVPVLRKLLNDARLERDEVKEKYDTLAVENMLEVNKLYKECDEMQKQLSSIHRWIERNHPDGFIDSLTYHQNLERITDNWYDRFDKIKNDKK